MTIENTYRSILTREFILAKLRSGVSVSAIDIKKELETLIATKDLTQPQFVASGHHVGFLEPSSSSKFNNTFDDIRQDLHVLYAEMLRLSQISIGTFERWSLESTSLERKLISLEDRVDDLLLLSQDTEGYHSIIIDNFSDMAFVDQTETTAMVDLALNEVTIAENSDPGVATRIFFNDITAEDVRFRVRNVAGFLGMSDAIGTSLTNPFRQESLNWWTSIRMSSMMPVTCELTIKLGEESIELTKIFMAMHDSVQSGPVSITPMYSEDNLVFTQLPSNTFTQQLRTHATFAFPQIQAKWIKFVITKDGPDQNTNNSVHEYQIGFKNISFYKEAFDTSTGQVMTSSPLFVVGTDSQPLEFSKLTLETCERVEEKTNIVYDIAVSNNSLLPVDPNTLWTRISPSNRSSGNHPTIISIGDITDTVVGLTEEVRPSYNAFATSGINPSDNFQLLSLSAGSVVDEAVSGLSTRYLFVNPDDRILNYQIKDSTYSGSGSDKLSLLQSSLILFRNVGQQGITPGDISEQVRDIQKGWGFKDPYYSCVVEVQNPEGITLGDVGPNKIFIDDVPYTGTIDRNIMTGRTSLSTGIHRIQIHKNNWKEVTINAASIDELKTLDPLYPHNQKLLIEGYLYDSSFVGSKVYNGVDLFAETQMQEVGTFEFLYNTEQDNYKLFTLDRDAASTHTGGNESTLVFVVKVDEENPDFQNERYVIRFKLLNDLRKYLRLRATFTTEDQTVAPSLDSYKIKLG